MESTANYSITPLAINRIYIGTWDKSLYPYAIVTLYANSSTEISCYQSLNKTHTEVVKFQTTADEYFTCNICLNLPYVYFTVRNNSSNKNQTVLNFSVVYKNNYIATTVPQKGSVRLFNNLTGLNGVSLSHNINLNSTNLLFFGSVDNTTTLTVQFSNDDVEYFDSQYISTSIGAQEYSLSLPNVAVKFVRIKSSANITANIYMNYN